MHLFHLLPFLLSLSSPSITAATPTLTNPLTLRKFNPLPNPYSVPGTPISLDFDPQSDAVLPRPAVLNLLTKTHANISRHIQTYGDGQIALGIQGFQLSGVQITYDSMPQYRIMLYSDVLTVIRGIRWKMEQEWYRERTAIVVFGGEGGGGEIETGEVDVGRVGSKRVAES
ncbi:MAG: hypothetical protein L6R42_007188 [Xanthoria sp. 1 TBL-2021]|nr:MAG: hypothetical protein L6R42_007188 [Xanthoria sp. 1 TBL-2021]